MNEAFWVVTTVVFGISTGCLAQAWHAARAEVDRLQQDTGSADATATLRRVESTVDAIALEVERVAEHQRLSSRILAERVVSTAPSD